jgi:DNA-directed RNA polymerase subunit RPC12/RpoP
MDVREKLVELLLGWGGLSNCAEDMADYFIENGVTVQECAEWEEIEDDWNMETIYKCSACKEEFVTIDGTPADNLWNYCPHCGAKMMPQPPKGE